MSAPDKPILDYASGKPTAAQQRRKWLLVTGLVGTGLAAGFVGWVWRTAATPCQGATVAPPMTTAPATRPTTNPSSDQ